MRNYLFLLLLCAFYKADAQDPAYPPAPPAPLNIVKAEYYIDTDPGFGSGIDITLTPGVDIASIPFIVNTTALSIGAHKLVIRSRSAEGHWSISSVRQFIIDFDPAYPLATAAPQSVIQAEYFVDTDPGFGNGTSITVSPAVNISGFTAAINTNLISPGGHRLYLRTLNNEGRWSVTGSRAFVIDENPAYPAAPSAPGNITFLEYFFDTDPGFGNGTAVSITPAVDINALTIPVNTAALTPGTHYLYIRSFDDWGMTSVRELLVSSTLPVTFASFSGKLQGNNVQLSWITSSEINSSHFEIERSKDGIHFSKIGLTAAAGNSNSRQDYAFIDPSLTEGTYYYRLRQVDNDGRSKYSAVISIRVRAKAEIIVMPNPASQQIQMTGLPLNSSYIIFDAAGRQERTGTWNGQPILLKGLSAGMYFLQVQQGDQWIRKPFIKQ